uniref:Rab-GAP TBC domain-containing protein n=1 Tax=Bionectria ochroleuca TaxID=29856 RepID=A0A8H7TVC1_BIOOC
MSARSLNTYHSGLSATSLRSSRSVIRQASNMLPQNRDRRVVDGASEMLTPGLHDIADEVRAEKISEALKRKEWERSEKWRKMAKNVRKGARGEGTEFEFDVKNPKLIERTWKGIPDRWRAAAWWSFLASSAQNDTESPSEEAIIKAFHELQDRSSPDDVQIDLDVPRTVSLHIMFRRRYEGGQRLLFRVLHALSIYFPETGYVQGMASLGATLLCYFDEEKSFVMLVRMWQLRGLERLYRHGFEGLMTALNEFETIWLHKDVAKKLTELGIEATAYGTRWYLTLFNLSLPFPAQLRVWDVFLLLGDSGSNPVEAKPQNKKSAATPIGPPTGLGILHATSAAIVQALREVLLDSDFENAMKSLTSFVSIQDEDLLMKVSKAEWKSHKGKRRA